MRKRMKQVLATVMSIALAVGGVGFTGKSTKDVKAADGYEGWDLVWSDEFNSTSLDTNVWNYEIGNGDWGWGNGEKEYYTNSTKNVEVSDGTLKIHALKENYGGQSYTSGRINTKGKKSFKYGRIEAKMKLPSFTGAWPAFWMLGANFNSVGWPKCGELDIMEAINTENFTHGHVHWWTEGADYTGHADAGSSSEGKLPEGYVRTDWHTYGIEWDKSTIKWYVDNKVFRTQNISSSDMDEFKKNQFIIFNLAVGGQWPGYTIDDSAFPSRSTMEVDYVRVYQKEEEPTTQYDGPTITVTQDAVKDYTGTWNSFFGNTPEWVVAAGNIETGNTPEEGFTAKISSVGKINNDSVWGVQSNLENLKYYPGNTYKYKCTITSDKDKRIFVKVADESEETMGGGLINLQAGVPYNFETDVAIPEDYTGTVSLKFGMGKTDGDSIADNSAVTINVKDVSFVTTATIPDPDYMVEQTTTPTENTTPKPGTEASTPADGIPQSTTVGSGAETTAAATNSNGGGTTAAKVSTLGKASIKKITAKKKASKKLKVSLKKIQGAKGYQIYVLKSKKAKKALYKKTTKKLKITLKSKKLQNKKLYIKVRAYKLDGKKKVYGKWSKVKKVKIK